MIAKGEKRSSSQNCAPLRASKLRPNARARDSSAAKARVAGRASLSQVRRQSTYRTKSLALQNTPNICHDTIETLVVA
jgi:hypothetical protein